MTSLRLAVLFSVAYALAPPSRPLARRRPVARAIDDYISDDSMDEDPYAGWAV